jgi:hypothetical protein
MICAIKDYYWSSSEWLSDMKPPMIRKLVVEAMGSLLQIPGEDISDYRVPAGSNYGPTLSELTSNPDECMSKLNRVDVQCLDNNAADILFTISHHPDWSEDSAASAYNSTEGLLTLFMLIDDVSQQLLSTPGRKPIVAENFMVAVDGSRMSHTAFEVAASLRGHGNLVVGENLTFSCCSGIVEIPLKVALHSRSVMLLTQVRTTCKTTLAPRTSSTISNASAKTSRFRRASLKWLSIQRGGQLGTH